MKNKLLMAAMLLALTGCTDAEMATWGALGDESTVTCYSGGNIIFTDTSTGKVLGTDSGVVFRSKTTGKYVKTYADCVVVSN